jgi:hypothetical protein
MSQAGHRNQRKAPAVEWMPRICDRDLFRPSIPRPSRGIKKWDRTIRPISTTSFCWASKAPCSRPNCTSCAPACGGNLLNKARRGELALRLPVGFRRRPDGVVVQDPDDAVRLAIGTVFERFAVLRNARAVQRHFLENRLVLPRCAQTGAAAGSISWVRPSYQMIQQILTNPAYAGVVRPESPMFHHTWAWVA